MRLRCERIVTPCGVIGGEVEIQDARIEQVYPGLRPGRSGAIELGERWLVPGYIDMHVHGGGGAQCNTSDPDEIAAVARFHACHGTTALLATTVAAPMQELEVALGAIARAGSPVLGAHLEGPFLSRARPGAMEPSAFISPEASAVNRLLSAGSGTIRMMTLAPELPGAIELVRTLVGAGVIASLGHSDAGYDETHAAVRAGARAATHLFNAMRPFQHREPGVLGAALDLTDVSCELICDGVHVDPAALRLAYRAKGTSGIRLVTDAMQAAGMSDGRYRLGRASVDVRSGVATVAGGKSIAGSTLTMDSAVRNAARFLGIAVPVAISMASANPAALLGLADRKGAIAVGLDADLAVLDEQLSCCGTVIGGEWVRRPQSG